MPTYTQPNHRLLPDGTENTERHPSRGIWADCPILEIIHEGHGVFFHDDFVNFSDHISDQSVQQYDSYIDTGVTINQRSGVATPGLGGVGGGIVVTGNDADNDEGSISTYGPAFVVSDTAANSRKLWFEARVAKNSITDEGLAFFVGLAHDHNSSATVAKANALTDDEGIPGAFSYLGFNVDLNDSELVDAGYKAEGQAWTVNATGIDTLVADTFVKLGFVYDPTAIAAERITWFVNGVPQTTFVTATNIAAATFPDEEPLALAFCTKTGTSDVTTYEVMMDWWRCAQLY